MKAKKAKARKKVPFQDAEDEAVALGVAAAWSWRGRRIQSAREANAVAERWRQAGCAATCDGNAVIITGKGWTIRDEGNRCTITGGASPEACRALAEKAKRDWSGQLELFGSWSETERAQCWLECQRAGVAMSVREAPSWQPPESIRRQWETEQASMKGATPVPAPVPRPAPGPEAQPKPKPEVSREQAAALAAAARAVKAYAGGRADRKTLPAGLADAIDALPKHERQALAEGSVADAMRQLPSLKKEAAALALRREAEARARLRERTAKTPSPAPAPGFTP